MFTQADTSETKDLVIKLQGGSLVALGALYDRYSRVVYRTTLGVTGDPEAAADLLQEVFLRLFRFAKRIDATRPFEPWLYRISVNLSYTWVKRRKWLNPLEDISEWLAGDNRLQPSAVAEQHETWDLVRLALSKLPLAQREVVVLHYINDRSLEEVSEILEIPIGTVKSRLHYGRAALRKYMLSIGSGIKEFSLELT